MPVGGVSSGHFPDKLIAAMKDYATVFSTRNGSTLVGLAAAMDNRMMTAYIHYLLVLPAYQRQSINQHLTEFMKTRYRDYLHLILPSYNEAIPLLPLLRLHPPPSDETSMFITELWT